MATLTQTMSSSCDVLFPEPDKEGSTHVRVESTTDAIYAAPSTSSYSTYSQEIRYIFDSNTGQARHNYSFEEDRARSLSNNKVLNEDIYTPPTPSAARRRQQQQQQQLTPPSGGYKTASGSALVVTGYVKDENHNHHQVKFVDINNSGAKLQDLNRSYNRSRSHDNRSADHVISYKSHEPGRLSHNKVWHHRSLDHLASYDNDQGYNYHSNNTSHHNNQSNAYSLYSAGSYGSNRSSNNQSGHSNLVRKPPVGQRPPPGAQGHPGVNAAQSSLPRKLHWSLSAARRRTWSPPMFRKVMGVGSSLAAMRSYHSNDQLDMEENYYEDLDAITGPPRLAPISGKLDNKHVDKSVIRPIAFKPIITPQSRYVPTPARSMLSPRQQRSHDLATTTTANHSTDDGYVSQDYNSGTHSHSTSNTSSSVSHNTSGQSHDSVARSHDPASPSADSSMIYSPPNRDRKHIPLPERPEPPPTNQHSSNYGYIQTPSPSDSGVCDIEAMLREKDSEIQTLRETMANNEAVIFQVYEEKRQNYAMELKEIHDEWSRRFRDHQQKTFKTEQALLLQMFKLQQERKTLKLDCETAKTEKESLHHKFEDLEGEHEKLNNKMEELQWELVQKKGEISHLKSQLKQSNSEQTHRNNDLFGLKSQLKDAAKDTESKDAEILRLKTELEMTTKDNMSLRWEVDQLREQLMMARREVEPLREELAHTRLQQETLVKQRSLTTSPAATTSPPVSPLATNAVTPVVAMVTSSSPSDIQRRGGEIDELKVELTKLKTEMERTCAQFEHERTQWLDEKNKVIRYQKHLQLNYVQMYRKNKMLETEVEQLMVELENRDLKLTSENGPIEGESTC